MTPETEPDPGNPGPTASSPEKRPPARATPRARTVAVPLGTFEWLLVGYLVVSGVVHLVRGFTPTFDDQAIDRYHAFRIATGTFSLLLTGQLIHRIPVARYSIALIFIMQIGLFLKRYAIESPFIWNGLVPLERTQRVLEFAFWVVAMVFVLVRPWRVPIGATLREDRFIR